MNLSDFMRNIFNRIKSKIYRKRIKSLRSGVPYQNQMSFIEKGTNWYDPVIAGPSTFIHDCTSAKTITAVAEIIKKLESDKFIDFIL